MSVRSVVQNLRPSAPPFILPSHLNFDPQMSQIDADGLPSVKSAQICGPETPSACMLPSHLNFYPQMSQIDADGLPSVKSAQICGPCLSESVKSAKSADPSLQLFRSPRHPPAARWIAVCIFPSSSGPFTLSKKHYLSMRSLSGGRLFTIFIVSRLTRTTRFKRSRM
jgi:hypothetical protein